MKKLTESLLDGDAVFGRHFEMIMIDPTAHGVGVRTAFASKDRHLVCRGPFESDRP